MKFSPDIGHKILWFWLHFLKVLILSSGCGFIFYKAVMSFPKAWKEKKRVKIWLCLSLIAFGIYILLIGIK